MTGNCCWMHHSGPITCAACWIWGGGWMNRLFQSASLLQAMNWKWNNSWFMGQPLLSIPHCFQPRCRRIPNYSVHVVYGALTQKFTDDFAQHKERDALCKGPQCTSHRSHWRECEICNWEYRPQVSVATGSVCILHGHWAGERAQYSL